MLLAVDCGNTNTVFFNLGWRKLYRHLACFDRNSKNRRSIFCLVINADVAAENQSGHHRDDYFVNGAACGV